MSVLAVARSRRAPRTGDSALPAWPVLTMLWGFPVFWALGLVVIAPAVLAMVMAGYLLQKHRVLVVPGVAAFAAFVFWVLPTAAMIDTVPRMMGFGFRLIILLIVATTLLYVVNARENLRKIDIVNALTFVWIFSIVGGYLGMLFPDVRLTTPIGLVLPHGLTSNVYVRDLFFPPFAEVQQPYGAPDPFVRPSAPYPYANSWGVAMVLLTPVAVARFLMSSSWRVRGFLLVALVALLVPAVASSNRGMFAGFALAAAYILVRLALRNRAAPVLAITGFSIVGLFALIASGLPQQIATRQLYSQTTDGRRALYIETFERTLRSPLLGYGAPRPSVEYEVSVGTQGYIWMLMFSFGFVGLALFLWFLYATTLRTWRAPTDGDLALHSVLVVACVVITFYGLDIMQLLTIVCVAAILLRDRYLPLLSP